MIAVCADIKLLKLFFVQVYFITATGFIQINLGIIL